MGYLSDKAMVCSIKDITVILACRDRGRFLHPSVRSVQAAVDRLQQETSLSVEVICTVDHPSTRTEEYLNDYLPSHIKVLRTNDGTLSACKNAAVDESCGNFLALVTSDTLVSSNWLHAAYSMALPDTRDVVFHPATLIMYGGESKLVVVPDEEDRDFCREALFDANPWPDTVFGRKNIFVKQRFSHAADFAEDDWHWNCETVSGGILHKPVHGTLACYRQHAPVPPPTPSSTFSTSHPLLPPSTLFQTSPGVRR